MIGCLEAIDGFVSEGLSDVALPYSEENLPRVIRGPKRAQFITHQHKVLSKQAIDLERSGGGHCNIDGNADVYFHLYRDLGSGGFGTVDHVFSRLSLRPFARKRIPRGRSFKKDQDAIQMFENELGIIKTLSHRHLVRLIGSYTDRKFVGLIVSPVADMDLQAYLMASKSEIPDQSIRLRKFFGCLTTAVEYLHQERIRHKDIKPQNILVKSGRVLLTDFGTSRSWADDSRGTTVGTHSQAFTKAYCAPEVAQHETRSTATDIWSLGCVFLEMCTVLSGKKVSDMRNFFANNGTGASFIRENPQCAELWIDHIKQLSPDSHDHQILDLIPDMCDHAYEKRPTATEIVSLILDFEGHMYYDFCCDRDQDYVGPGDPETTTMFTTLRQMLETSEEKFPTIAQTKSVSSQEFTNITEPNIVEITVGSNGESGTDLAPLQQEGSPIENKKSFDEIQGPHSTVSESPTTPFLPSEISTKSSVKLPAPRVSNEIDFSLHEGSQATQGDESGPHLAIGRARQELSPMQIENIPVAYPSGRTERALPSSESPSPSPNPGSTLYNHVPTDLERGPGTRVESLNWQHSSKGPVKLQEKLKNRDPDALSAGEQASPPRWPDTSNLGSQDTQEPVREDTGPRTMSLQIEDTSKPPAPQLKFEPVSAQIEYSETTREVEVKSASVLDSGHNHPAQLEESSLAQTTETGASPLSTSAFTKMQVGTGDQQQTNGVLLEPAAVVVVDGNQGQDEILKTGWIEGASQYLDQDQFEVLERPSKRFSEPDREHFADSSHWAADVVYSVQDDSQREHLPTEDLVQPPISNQGTNSPHPAKRASTWVDFLRSGFSDEPQTSVRSPDLSPPVEDPVPKPRALSRRLKRSKPRVKDNPELRHGAQSFDAASTALAKPVELKSFFQIPIASSQKPEDIRQDLIIALKQLRIGCKAIPGGFACCEVLIPVSNGQRLVTESTAYQDGANNDFSNFNAMQKEQRDADKEGRILYFEVTIVEIPTALVNGVQFKRLRGSEHQYRATTAKILGMLRNPGKDSIDYGMDLLAPDTTSPDAVPLDARFPSARATDARFPNAKATDTRAPDAMFPNARAPDARPWRPRAPKWTSSLSYITRNAREPGK